MYTRLYRLKIIFLFQLFTYLWLIADSAVAQEYQYFNKRLDLNGMNEIDRSYNILMVENGYIIAGNSLTYSGNKYWWRNVIAKLDFEGHLLFNKDYGEDSVDYFFSPFPGYFIKSQDHFYGVGKKRTAKSDWIHDEGTLLYFDENLDTLWMKKYGENIEPYDTALLFTCLRKLINGHLIIAGAKVPDLIPTQVYLMKTDSLGNKIWDNSIAYYNFYIEAASIAQTYDSGFIIGCYKQLIGYPNTVDPVLIKTDSIGNQIWTRNLGGNFKDNSAIVCISEDSAILVGTNYADSMYTPDVAYSRINIIKLDIFGNIIWNKKYGESKPNNYLLNIRALDDSSIIAVGSIRKYNPEPDWVGWILKTNFNGDSLWYREYYILSGQQSLNYLYDIVPTLDTGFITCGYIHPFPPDTGSVDTWVIKLDSIGCEWAGCDTTVGVEEHEGGEAGKHGGMEAWRQGSVVVWPNPASEMLNVECSRLNAGSSYDLTVYDIFGRPAYSSTLQGGGWEGGSAAGDRNRTGCVIDVSSLPPGVYFISVLEDGKQIAGGKFVVAR